VSYRDRHHVIESNPSTSDLEGRDGTGERAVHIATRNGRRECLARVLSRGADPHSVNDDGYTALHWGCLNGRYDELQLLFEYVCEPDPRDAIDRTPLHYAASNGHLDVLRLMIDKRANINAIESKQGDSVLHYAVRNGNAQAVETLLKHGANHRYCNLEGDVRWHMNPRCCSVLDTDAHHH